MKQVVVKQAEFKPEVAAEVIAQSIVEISTAMKKLSSTRLARKAIVALIHDHSNLGKGTIECVLNNLEGLEQTWLKEKK